MKIISIVGARPQFVKAAVLSRELRKSHTEILVHTGQHYDDNMSKVFFQDLGIPQPEYALNIGSGSHGAQTGAMLTAIEQVLIKEQPDWVVVYGDTNSTLAGALAAAKLHIRVAHVEAGLRSFNRAMPEEINRVLTDHISELLFCPTPASVSNLHAEGITQGVHQVGDIMFDALQWAAAQSENLGDLTSKWGLHPQQYLLATVHRAENTDDPVRLKNILQVFNEVNETVLWPVHPRTRKILVEIKYVPAPQVRMIEPVGYLDMVRLVKNSRLVLTDSGGLQKESMWMGVPCVTLRDETEWIETVSSGWNVIAGTDPATVLKAIQTAFPPNMGQQSEPAPQSAGEAMVRILTTAK